jgi:hypothetical protein
MAGENINRRLNIYINDKEVVNSMRGVTAAMNQVRNQIRNLDASAEDYDEQLKKLKTTLFGDNRMQLETLSHLLHKVFTLIKNLMERKQMKCKR